MSIFQNQISRLRVFHGRPYKGRNKKGGQERDETSRIFAKYPGSFASLDYVSNWILKAVEYSSHTDTDVAFVATNSVCQGEQVALLWPIVFREGCHIHFAHTSFKWANLASDKAGVTVVIVGLSRRHSGPCSIFFGDEARAVSSIGPYLVPDSLAVVEKRSNPIAQVSPMYLGNMAKDGGNLIMDLDEGRALVAAGVPQKFVRKFYGSEEMINARPRACIWVSDDEIDEAVESPAIAAAFERVRQFRAASPAGSTQKFAVTPHRFVQMSAKNGDRAIVIPRVSSENRAYLPVDILKAGPIIGDKCYGIYDAPIWNLSLIASTLHRVWIATVCSRLRTDYSYGNKLGWNTFPIPKLTEQMKADLTACAEDILLAREAHFPATIADLYDPEAMPENLRAAHDRNDEVLERIYIGRRFRNDTERLEKLFELYTKMTAKGKAA